MCYKYKEPEDLQQAEMVFNAELFDPDFWSGGREVFGFDHPYCPIILDRKVDLIVAGYWGLVHQNAATMDRKEYFKRSNTLNAKIETVEKLFSYKNYVDNRCLILAQEFIEYKHVPSGKSVPNKIPYRIYAQDKKPFAMAGIYSMIGNEPTFTILTTEANTLMAEIHNSAKRMPVILKPEEQKLWLNREPLQPYHSRKEVELEAIPYHGQQPTLL